MSDWDEPTTPPRGRPLDEARLRAALAQLTSALQALHGVDLVHRDVKPSNILVTGRIPFEGGAMEVLLQKQHAEPPPPRSLVPEVPADLDALCLRGDFRRSVELSLEGAQILDG